MGCGRLPSREHAPTGELGIEITPVLAAPSLESKVAAQLDALLRRTCQIARALTGAEQAALKLWVGEDSSQARKYFSLSEKYAEFRDFRVDPKGIGLHGMTIPPGQVIRLTEGEVLSHPLYRGFGSLADAHPPMRGWLATSICGDNGRVYGLLQLSDKSGGRDFEQSDETNIHELAALIGETLDAVRLAAQRTGASSEGGPS
jgi:GAF domain-containing protein